MSDKDHVQWAQEMKDRFPDLLAPFTTERVCEIWEWYSAVHWAAGWIGGGMDQDEERVRKVFTNPPSQDELASWLY